MFKRIIVLVMDSVGIGDAPDAEKFGDKGADTIGHIDAAGALQVPTLRSMGLGQIAHVRSNEKEPACKGLYGRMTEISAGKDTTSGHWEFMGHPVEESFPTFPKGFPDELIKTFTKETGYEVLGNEVASGTEIIERLGQEHIKTGKPIVYTSADSVFQIAAHTDVIPLEELYRICKITREKVCQGKYNVGRIIARPFIGQPGSFVRTADRHDYSRKPVHTLDTEILKEAGYQTIGVGKIGDIYAHIGLTASYPTRSNSHGMNKTAELLGGEFKKGLLLINLVEFDSLFGHRRNVDGYRQEIEHFDYQLKGLLPLLERDDLLLITADHGNDPTWTGTDHTRERVPLLGYTPQLKGLVDVGTRTTYADLGQTILDNFGCENSALGKSFLSMISNGLDI